MKGATMKVPMLRCVGCAGSEYPCEVCWEEARRVQEAQGEWAWKKHQERWMKEGATLVEVG